MFIDPFFKNAWIEMNYEVYPNFKTFVSIGLLSHTLCLSVC